MITIIEQCIDIGHMLGKLEINLTVRFITVEVLVINFIGRNISKIIHFI